MAWDDPDIRKNPGVGGEPSKHPRLPCPVCKTDLSIEQLNAVHSSVYAATEKHALGMRSKDSYDTNRFGHLDYPIDSAQSFERHFSPEVDTFKRGRGRRELVKQVDCYFEVCVTCGLLWDPYARVRRDELNRTIGLAAEFMKMTPVDLVAKLADDWVEEL